MWSPEEGAVLNKQVISKRVERSAPTTFFALCCSSSQFFLVHQRLLWAYVIIGITVISTGYGSQVVNVDQYRSSFVLGNALQQGVVLGLASGRIY